jgi:hypothetical protein
MLRNRRLRNGLITALSPLLISAAPTQPGPEAAAVALPPPVLSLASTEAYTAGGKRWVRYRYQVANAEFYPQALFAPAPDLPPCGSNTNASRSWVDFFAEDGKRLYGFCALGSPEDLNKIWFAAEVGAPPPEKVYIVMDDRLTGASYKSNLAYTELWRTDP